MFFAISGFLIAASWARKSHPIAFSAARFFRIFPGLAVMLVFRAFVWGALDYYRSSTASVPLPARS
jgi:peptidoglycan/LPS O-acetylase OafA/YrhL